MRRLGILVRHLNPLFQPKTFDNFHSCNAIATSAIDTNSNLPISFKSSFVCRVGISALSKEKSLEHLLDFTTGEDACFVEPLKSDKKFSKAFGVADGVGGWRNRGIDPSAMSNALMNESHAYLKSNPNHLHNPKTILIEAFQNVVQNKKVEAGSTTACIATIDGNHVRVANLGDSGVRILRKSKQDPSKFECVFQTEEQTHFFNAPYQIGIIPKSMSNNALQDSPHDAHLYNFEIQEGDVIICATDGLFDNVFTHDLCDIATHMHQESLNATEENKTVEFVNVLAMALVISARQISVKKDVVTPFSARAEQEGYARARGGKFDDITVIVAQVQKHE